VRIVGNPPSGGKKPTTPTIGTATDGGTGTTVSVAFTPSTYIGKGTITYTATSSPGSLTGTGSGSPITVSGLTTGTAYTFTVAGTTNYGVASDSSAASNSVTPVTPSSFESIATATGTGSSGTITFSSIPSTYKHLQIRFIVFSNVDGSNVGFQFNGDTGNNYTQHQLYGGTYPTTAAKGANANTAQPKGWAGSYDAGTRGSYPTVGIIDIVDYASTTKYKTVRVLVGTDTNGTANQEVTLDSSLWLNTAAINSITLLIGGNYTTSTQFALYGIKG